MKVKPVKAWETKERYEGFTYLCGDNFSFHNGTLRSKNSGPIVKAPHQAYSNCPCLNACECNYGHKEKKFKHEHPRHKLYHVRVIVEIRPIQRKKKRIASKQQK